MNTLGKLSCFALAALLGSSCLVRSYAAEFPEKPIHIISPFAAGGAVDILARRVGSQLSKQTGVPVVVENKPGGGGVIGTQAVVSAAPDGYTWLLHSGAITTEAVLKNNLPYDMATDLTAVSKVTELPAVVLITDSFKVKTVAELIAYARAQPGRVNFGSSGLGSSTHFGAELFKSMAAIDIVHVPYKGGAPSWQALMAGEIQLLIDPIATAKQSAKTGKVRGIAVTSKQRSDFWPELPTASESGLPGYEMSFWYGLFVPAKTPVTVVQRINQLMTAALMEKETNEWLKQQGFIVVGNASSAFVAENSAELKIWANLVRTNHITAE